MAEEPNFSELRNRKLNWDIDGEAELLRKLKLFTDSYKNSYNQLSKNISSFQNNLEMVEIEQLKSINLLKTLSINKFVEHVVDDSKKDGEEEQKENENNNIVDINQILQNIMGNSVNCINEINNNSNNNNNNNSVVQNEDENQSVTSSKMAFDKLFKNERLPNIIGTTEFMSDPYCGLLTLESEEIKEVYEDANQNPDNNGGVVNNNKNKANNDNANIDLNNNNVNNNNIPSVPSIPNPPSLDNNNNPSIPVPPPLNNNNPSVPVPPPLNNNVPSVPIPVPPALNNPSSNIPVPSVPVPVPQNNSLSVPEVKLEKNVGGPSVPVPPPMVVYEAKPPQPKPVNVVAPEVKKIEEPKPVENNFQNELMRRVLARNKKIEGGDENDNQENKENNENINKENNNNNENNNINNNNEKQNEINKEIFNPPINNNPLGPVPQMNFQPTKKNIKLDNFLKKDSKVFGIDDDEDEFETKIFSKSIIQNPVTNIKQNSMIKNENNSNNLNNNVQVEEKKNQC